MIWTFPERVRDVGSESQTKLILGTPHKCRLLLLEPSTQPQECATLHSPCQACSRWPEKGTQVNRARWCNSQSSGQTPLHHWNLATVSEPLVSHRIGIMAALVWTCEDARRAHVLRGSSTVPGTHLFALLTTIIWRHCSVPGTLLNAGDANGSSSPPWQAQALGQRGRQ